MSGDTSLALNAWTHVALTWDGATMRLWVNGVQVASGAQGGVLEANTNPLRIGGTRTGSGSRGGWTRSGSTTGR